MYYQWSFRIIGRSILYTSVGGEVGVKVCVDVLVTVDIDGVVGVSVAVGVDE